MWMSRSFIKKMIEVEAQLPGKIRKKAKIKKNAGRK